MTESAVIETVTPHHRDQAPDRRKRTEQASGSDEQARDALYVKMPDGWHTMALQVSRVSDD